MQNIYLALRIALFAFLLFYPCFFLQAQSTKQPEKRRPGVKNIGFDLGIGAGTIDFADFNAYVSNLNIPQLESEVSSVSFSAIVGTYEKISASFNVSGWGTSGSTSSAYLNYRNTALGGTLYTPLMQMNRIALYALGGVRMGYSHLYYNANTRFTGNLATYVANPNSVYLKSENTMLNAGGRFQYRIGKKEKVKPHEFRLGLDSGYIYSLKNSDWTHVGNGAPVADMPALKPDNWYLHLTFSYYFAI